MKTLAELQNVKWFPTSAKLDDVHATAETQYREEIDNDIVEEYAQAMRDGSYFPPVKAIFDGGRYILVDGFHRYFAIKALGTSTIRVEYTDGDIGDARILALSANCSHGLRRSNTDKWNAVKVALGHPLTKDLPDNQIAKICGVSRSFVGSVRDPVVRNRQRENTKRRLKSAKEVACSGTTKDQNAEDTAGLSYDGTSSEDFGPSESEFAAFEIAEQKNREALAQLLESDDKIKHLLDENKKLNLLNARFEVRIEGLMNERNAAVKRVKYLERQLKMAIDKLNIYNPSSASIKVHTEAVGRDAITSIYKPNIAKRFSNS